MFLSYEDACEATVSSGAAEAEILRHYADFIEFVEDCGVQEEYKGNVILDWLGWQTT